MVIRTYGIQWSQRVTYPLPKRLQQAPFDVCRHDRTLAETRAKLLDQPRRLTRIDTGWDWITRSRLGATATCCGTGCLLCVSAMRFLVHFAQAVLPVRCSCLYTGFDCSASRQTAVKLYDRCFRDSVQRFWTKVLQEQNMF